MVDFTKPEPCPQCKTYIQYLDEVGKEVIDIFENREADAEDCAIILCTLLQSMLVDACMKTPHMVLAISMLESMTQNTMDQVISKLHSKHGERDESNS